MYYPCSDFTDMLRRLINCRIIIIIITSVGRQSIVFVYTTRIMHCTTLVVLQSIGMTNYCIRPHRITSDQI